MPIRVWDYLKEYEQEKQETLEAVEKVLASGWLILGEQVKKFETAFAEYCDASFGVGVNSGTDALFLALKSLDIGQGDEVITVSNTAVPTVSAICATGATPRFVDIDTESYLMDCSQLEDVITERTRCIIPVHLFGQCVNMERLQHIARSHDCKVLEDCAQSHGAKFKGKRAGSMSDLSAFSFYPTKVLGTYGDGGMILTSEKQLYERLKRLRFYGMEKTYFSLEHGFNSRLDEMQAAILRVKFKRIEGYIEKRKAIARRYDEAFADTSLILPKVMPDNDHVYYLYVCRHPRRDQISERLREEDINVAVHYPWPIHIMPAYQYIGYKEQSLPNTEKMAKEIFSLPMYPSLDEHEQTRVIDVLRKVLNGFD